MSECIHSEKNEYRKKTSSKNPSILILFQVGQYEKTRTKTSKKTDFPFSNKFGLGRLIPMSTIDIAGCGDASDRARFRNYAALRIIMTNAIGVAKTAIANRPISNTNWVIRPRVLLDKIRPETRPFIKP